MHWERHFQIIVCQKMLRNRTLVQHNSVVEASDCVITGHNNKITGSRNTIHGHNNKVQGSWNQGTGHNNRISGDHNTWTGHNNHLTGIGNQSSGNNNSVFSSATTDLVVPQSSIVISNGTASVTGSLSLSNLSSFSFGDHVSITSGMNQVSSQAVETKPSTKSESLDFETTEKAKYSESDDPDCKICLSRKNQCVLSCEHALCVPCWKNIVKTNKEANKPSTCPFCRETITSKPKLLESAFE